MPFAWFVAFRYMRAAKAQTALILAAVSVGVGVVVFRMNGRVGVMRAALSANSGATTFDNTKMAAAISPNRADIITPRHKRLRAASRSSEYSDC